MDLNFKSLNLQELDRPAILNEEHFIVSHSIDRIAKIDCLVRLRSGATRTVVLMPSAQSTKSGVKNPVFHRWTWANSLPDCNVFCFSDPSLYYGSINAGWFIGNGQIDIIDRMSDFLRAICDRLAIALDEPLFYGSSMGGYGALMLAAKFDNAMAVAELPQIDLLKYPMKGALQAIEKICLCDLPLIELGSQHPERINVLRRFAREKRVPSFRLITNRADHSHAEHIEFVLRCSEELRRTTHSIGDISITVLALESGHRPLPTPQGVGVIQSIFAAGWTQKQTQQPTYRELIDEALALASKVNFTRTTQDAKNYEAATELLLQATRTNQEADWPFLKLCSLVKQWTNSFNENILKYSLAALERKETLEAFIYACRGLLYNRDPEIAAAEISRIANACSDPHISNVANIFLATLKYNEGKFDEYCSIVENFKKIKTESFNPYIATPISTIYTGNIPQATRNIEYHICGTALHNAPIKKRNLRYIVSASCDSRYFAKYGKFLVKSFEKTCGDEAALHLSILNAENSFVNSELSIWGGGSTEFVTQNIEVGDNVGPISSILRFCHVAPLLDRHSVPVIVMDLDAVILKPMAGLIDKFQQKKPDVLSRILERGVAPWERYTGGLAVFFPTDPGRQAAHDLAHVASAVARAGNTQWWIDQNCFEAAVRFMKMRGQGQVVDIYNVRNEYCIMPVGPELAKLHSLNDALRSIDIT